MKRWVLYVSFLTAHFFYGIICQSILLTPTQAFVDINETLTFTCTYIGYGEVIGIRWNIDNTYTPNIVRHQDGTCSGGGLFADNNIYRVGCPSDTSFSVTILFVQLDNHNVQWECFDRDRKSNTVTIFVKVPVVNVSLHLVGPSSSFIKEHSRQTIKCKTSPGRPQPNARWFLYEANNNVKHKITVNSSIQIISSGAGLVSVESTLQFYPNRSINEWMLNCEAWTNNKTRALQSKGLTLNIAYPPDRPPVISGFENGEKYPLIESEIGKLSCTTHGGNPFATLTWKCYNNEPESTTIEDKNVTSTVSWPGLRDQSSCTCISNHSWSGTTQTTTIQIDVLYSPNKPTLIISNTDVSNVINVILNNTVHVKCESKSKPHPTYSWTGPADMHNIYYYHPPGKPYFKYEYSNGTKGSTQNMIDVITGDSFSVHCRATGNPQPTIKWDSNEGNDILKIPSITYDTRKTCHAMYTMEETVGERRTGSTSASFFIRVLYPPHIPKFTISNGTRQVNVTTATIQLKKTDNINITCFF
ncbi:uncharacterized protein LOC132724508 [Ruditapes philippinarum]|uniref:uncharacterized protein LOC132724508 n=1 Tax=Ruditapes philippinarum TaxID=129788 RepID=UPI00295C0512|nr:uncharacterized protein LOC132724508 [Ruditapes philippinarum]